MTQPGGGANGAVWPVQPVVQVQDVHGYLATSNTDYVQLSIASGPSGAILSCAPAQAVGGIATFAGCYITGPASVAGTTYTLTATDTTQSLNTDTSNPFTITLGSPYQVAFASQPPASATDGASWPNPPVLVSLEDIFGNTITTNSTDRISLAIASRSPTGSLSCNRPQRVRAGIATFSGCSITGPASAPGTSYSLTATDASNPGVLSATSTPVALGLGAPSQLGFTTQPPSTATDGVSWPNPPVQVAIQDVGGNTVTTNSSDHIVLAIGPGSPAGALACSGGATQQVNAGMGTFNGCYDHRHRRHLHTHRHRCRRSQSHRHQRFLHHRRWRGHPGGVHHPAADHGN